MTCKFVASLPVDMLITLVVHATDGYYVNLRLFARSQGGPASPRTR